MKFKTEKKNKIEIEIALVSTRIVHSHLEFKLKNEIKNCNSKLKKIKIKIEIAQISVRVLHSSNLTWQSIISTITSIDVGEDLTITGSK